MSWTPVPEAKKQVALAMLAANIPYRTIAEVLEISVGTVARLARQGEAPDLALATEIEKRSAAMVPGAKPWQKEDTGWDRLWKAARIKRRFTLSALAAITGESASNVRSFADAYRGQWLRPCGKTGNETVWTFTKQPPPRRPKPNNGGKDAGLETTS